MALVEPVLWFQADEMATDGLVIGDTYWCTIKMTHIRIKLGLSNSFPSCIIKAWKCWKHKYCVNEKHPHYALVSSFTATLYKSTPCCPEYFRKLLLICNVTLCLMHECMGDSDDKSAPVLYAVCSGSRHLWWSAFSVDHM